MQSRPSLDGRGGWPAAIIDSTRIPCAMTCENSRIWLRAEHKPQEARAAIVPQDAARLLAAGHPVVVETSSKRAFPIEAYVAAGCSTAAEGAWREAPTSAVIVGLKELGPELGPFRHRHVHFAHAYKGQGGWRETLQAFADGGGTLLDLEYLVDDDGRRVAAFGERAGFVGAALGLLAVAARRSGRAPSLTALEHWDSGAELVEDVVTALADEWPTGEPPRVLVIGAAGRSGRGAVAAGNACGAAVSAWDVAETAEGGPFEAVLEHDVLVSCVFVDGPLPPFTTSEHLQRSDRRLRVIVDVGCDPTGAYNPLPIYDTVTTLGEPTRQLVEVPPLDLVAIDHLPSLLPVESSVGFSAELLPHLLNIDRPDDAVWCRARAMFEGKLAEVLRP